MLLSEPSTLSITQCDPVGWMRISREPETPKTDHSIYMQSNLASLGGRRHMLVEVYVEET